MNNLNFKEIVTSINNAFFRLEAFMNDTIDDYNYFGFDNAFTNLFIEAKKTENYTYENCVLIDNYYSLLSQIAYDYDKSVFLNGDAYENQNFELDCNEITSLQWDRVEEFCNFNTPDIIEEAERKFSITGILKEGRNKHTSIKPNKAKPKQPCKLFPEYLTPVKSEFLAEAIKAAFAKDKPITFAILIHTLRNELEIPLLIINNGEFLDFHKAMTEYFKGIDIGTRQLYNLQKSYKSEILNCKTRINAILKSIDKK